MIVVNTGTTNDIQYLSRYNQIDKYTILDHSTRDITSGETYLIAVGEKIFHTGITYQFQKNCLYTYKSYFLYNTKYYLANISLLTTYENNKRVDNQVVVEKTKNTFKVKK